MKKIIIIILFFIFSFNIYALDYNKLYSHKYSNLYSDSKESQKENIIKFKKIIKNLYRKGKFDEADLQLTDLMERLPANLRDDALYYLAKINYKLNRLDNTYNDINEIIQGYPYSSLIKKGKLASTIYKIIKYEFNNKPNTSISFVLELYYLLDKLNNSKQYLYDIQQMLNNYSMKKVSISIDLTRSQIKKYLVLKKNIVNKIWRTFFPYLALKNNESFDLEQNVSIFQINRSFSYYSKYLYIKLNIEDLYGFQSTKYTAVGNIETSLQEFLNSLNITINDLLSKNTNKYNYKEEF